MILVKFTYYYYLHILYTQLIRIMLATHVLPRLLAHVLAMASTFKLLSLFYSTKKLYNYCSLRHFHQFAWSCVCTLPKIPHCCILCAGLFSYPVWLIVHKNQLKIFNLHKLCNCLILNKIIKYLIKKKIKLLKKKILLIINKLI